MITESDIPVDEDEITDMHLAIARAVNDTVADKIEEKEPHATNQIRALRGASEALLGGADTTLYRN